MPGEEDINTGDVPIPNGEKNSETVTEAADPFTLSGPEELHTDSDVEKTWGKGYLQNDALRKKLKKGLNDTKSSMKLQQNEVHNNL